MKCGQCKKLLKQETIATKTRKIGNDYIVVEQHEALVCPTHGVIVLDPVQAIKYVPQPWVPSVPYRPWFPYGQTPITPTRVYPTLTYGGTNNSSGATLQLNAGHGIN